MNDLILDGSFDDTAIHVTQVGLRYELAMIEPNGIPLRTVISAGGVTYLTSDRLVARAALTDSRVVTEIVGRTSIGGWRLFITEGVVVLVARQRRFLRLPSFFVRKKFQGE